MAEAADEETGDAPKRFTSTPSRARKELTVSVFQEWTDKCRATQANPDLANYVKEAEEGKMSLQEVLEAKGIQEEDLMKGSKWPLTCTPSDLGELGSGFVLYFYLLRYLIAVLFGLFVVGIPALVVYATAPEGAITLWGWHDWMFGGWLDDHIDKPCACLGTNNGFYGVDGWANESYGTSCRAWDLDLCKKNAGSANLGKWCCRSWCFADMDCRVEVQPGLMNSPSLANRHLGDLVRATTECAQDPALLEAECGDLPDTPYNTTMPEQGFTWRIWMTPGNLGPRGGDKQFPLLFYVLGSIGLAFANMSFVQFLRLEESLVDEKTRMPCDFSVLVSGLPHTATSERAIAEFFREHAIAGQDNTEVVSVVIGWDMHHHVEATKTLAKLRKKLQKNRDRMSQAEIEDTMMRIHELRDAHLDDSGLDQLECDGTAVVVFRHRKELLECEQRWNGSLWAKYCNREKRKGCMSLGNYLPLFEGKHVLRVRRAPNPGDINWEDLDKQQCCVAWMSYVRGHAMMWALICICFFITWAASLAQEELESRGKQARDSYTFQALSLLPAAIVSVVNVSLRTFAWYFASTEHHATKTDQESAEAYMMSYSMIINTSGVIFWVNMQPREWYMRGGLADDIMYLLAFDAITTRLFFLLDTWYFINWRQRRKVTEESVADLRRRIQASIAQKTEEQVEELEAVRRETNKIKEYFAPAEMYNPYSYATALTTFFVCVFYAPLLPMAPLLGIVGLSLQYAIDKWLLLRWCKRQKPQNSMLAFSAMRAVKYVAPVALCISFFIFLAPAWKDPVIVRNFALAGILLYIIIIFVVPERLWCALAMYFRKKKVAEIRKDLRSTHTETFQETAVADDYYRAQYLWQKDMKYHKDHALYKMFDNKINPEIIQPDEPKIRELRDFCKVGHERKVRRTEAPKTGFSGQSVLGSAVAPPSGFGRTLATPETYGVPVVEDGRPKPSVSFSSTPAPQPGGHWPAHTDRSKSFFGGHVSFEFETRHGFQSFASDCQQHLEERYQAYINKRGPARIRITTSGKHVSIDFERMTQKVEGEHSKVRKIRRLDKE